MLWNQWENNFQPHNWPSQFRSWWMTWKLPGGLQRQVIKHWNHSKSIDVFPTEESWPQWWAGEGSHGTPVSLSLFWDTHGIWDFWELSWRLWMISQSKQPLISRAFLVEGLSTSNHYDTPSYQSVILREYFGIDTGSQGCLASTSNTHSEHWKPGSFRCF